MEGEIGMSQKHARPEMTRRAVPNPGAEQGAKDHAAMMERLKVLTGAKPIAQIDSHEANQPVKPITQTVTVPNGYVAEPPVLEWHKPVRHANGEATQTSTGGSYAVFGRRSPSGFVFIAKRGLDSLGAPQTTAEAARDICLAHHVESCA
jgi:hypothetical protein